VPQMDKTAIGHKISSMRKERGLTQKALAEKLHVSDKTVSKWETGTHFPDIAMIEDLAAALEISAVELLCLENASSEEMIAEMAWISAEEKNAIVREIKTRGWITVIIGLILLGSMIYTSSILAQHGLYGLPQSCTSGMSGFIGILISNGLVSIYKGKKLMK